VLCTFINQKNNSWLARSIGPNIIVEVHRADAVFENIFNAQRFALSDKVVMPRIKLIRLRAAVRSRPISCRGADLKFLAADDAHHATSNSQGVLCLAAEARGPHR
jgi:hypothetical protein